MKMVAMFRVFILKLILLISFSSTRGFTATTGAFRTTSTLRISSKSSLAASSAIESSSISELKRELLEVIPKRPSGGPATNVTTSEDVCLKIEELVSKLEKLAPLPPLANSSEALEAIDGEWQLVFSDASEITNIAKLPMGFQLGPVYQPIDVKAGRLENQALIKHKLLLFSGHTRVVADFSLAEIGDVNPAGKANIGERANVQFRKVVFTLRRFLFLPTFGKIRKSAIPNGRSEQNDEVPSIDITYLDETMRIARGGFGSLFVLTRPDGSNSKIMKMLSEETAESINVDPTSPTYDPSVDILPSGSRD